MSELSTEDIIHSLATLTQQGKEHGAMLQQILEHAKQTNGRVNAHDVAFAVQEAKHEAFQARWREETQQRAELGNKVEQLMGHHVLRRQQERDSEKAMAKWIAIGTGLGGVLATLAGSLVSLIHK